MTERKAASPKVKSRNFRDLQMQNYKQYNLGDLPNENIELYDSYYIFNNRNGKFLLFPETSLHNFFLYLNYK